jgi:hypothetical protein
MTNLLIIFVFGYLILSLSDIIKDYAVERLRRR